jgi:hypothetical protein
MRLGVATRRFATVACLAVACAACSKTHDAIADASPELSDAATLLDEGASIDASPIDDVDSSTTDASAIDSVDAPFADSGGGPPVDDAGADDGAGPNAGEAGADSAADDAGATDGASLEDAALRDDAWVEGGPSEIIAGTSYAEAEALGDLPTTHTHVLFGTETLYISHLPLWESPHDFQSETAISMDDGARAIYLQDRASSGTLLYTVLPQAFALPSLIAPDASSLSLYTDIYRGDLEDSSGVHIAVGTLSAPRSLHFRHLDQTTPRPAEPAYLLFGSATEAFLVHLFTTRPDFGQILAVELPPALAADARLADGIQLRLPGQDPTVPLVVGATTAVRIADTGDVTTLKVVAEVYLDLVDLQ